MRQPPTMVQLSQVIETILAEKVDVKGAIDPKASLMKEMNLDSLDMIELSFSLEEFFGFEFATKDAFETLDAATQGAVLQAGQFTELGRQILMRRAPELVDKALPDQLSPMILQQFYSVETFARLIREFYLAAPDVCPRTGEPVVARDFKIVSESSNEPVGTLTGDDILDAWVETMAAELGTKTP